MYHGCVPGITVTISTATEQLSQTFELGQQNPQIGWNPWTV